MAALRLNIPVIFVSGGPMEAGKTKLANPPRPRPGRRHGDRRRRQRFRREVAEVRAQRLPDLRFVLRHVHRQLDELPDRSPGPGAAGQRHRPWPPTADREQLFLQRRPRRSSSCAKRYYGEDDESVLPRNIASFKAFENAMTLDIAMGGSDQHHPAPAGRRPGSRDRLRPARHRPPVASRAAAVQGRAEHPEVPHGRRAPRRRRSSASSAELARGGLLHTDLPTVHSQDAWPKPSPSGTSPRPADEAVHTLLQGRPGRHPDPDRVQPVDPLGQPWTTTVKTAASAVSSTPTRKKAAWPCCTATSPSTAAW